MKNFLRKLWKNEEGAEIVEWVIVAAVLIGIAAGGYALLGDSVNNAVNTRLVTK
ncbi:MAG: Flp family type IVb pilin [Halochromatium sp.]|nr:Flp family type IVb pilin [Halochromatium sp.]